MAHLNVAQNCILPYRRVALCEAPKALARLASWRQPHLPHILPNFFHPLPNSFQCFPSASHPFSPAPPVSLAYCFAFACAVLMRSGVAGWEARKSSMRGSTPPEAGRSSEPLLGRRLLDDGPLRTEPELRPGPLGQRLDPSA